MSETINWCIAGERNHVGDAIVYGDTDSSYFSAWPILKDKVASGEVKWDKDICVQLYDSIAEEVNKDFPRFMKEAFNCPHDKGSIIKAGREIVAQKGLFITKKRYALLYYDKEGKRVDVNGKDGKVKAMGLDLKRADTPKIVQAFLLDILNDVLHGKEKDFVIDKIKDFKQSFRILKPWEKGSPKRVNNLTSYTERKTNGKVSIPGHVRAAINWNSLREMNSDRYSMFISDGQKAIVCTLKDNPMGFKSVAYPTDELRLPTWFLELPFDESHMEKTVVDQKVENLLGVLNWELDWAIDDSNNFHNLFEFD